jgi:predicted nucleic acid-binding protein
MTFVDTSAWYAAYMPSDPQHRAVQKVLAAPTRLITTDYVLDETLTLLKARGHAERALRFGPRVLDGRAAQLEYVSPKDVEQAWVVFTTYRDKDWSFTDCTSFIVMKRLGLVEAIALDQHFRQMPGVSVLPIAT